LAALARPHGPVVWTRASAGEAKSEEIMLHQSQFEQSGG
jgi:hypothetical protein